ncbi:MAG: hypothetical protein LQ341_004154 [Variospora aurantia]|nr:MAG: hypothetical protein LQ341_004154 [Variospora aurantia]
MSLYEPDSHSDSTSVLPAIDLEKHPATHQQHEEERQDESQYPTGLKLIFIMASLMLGTTIMSLDTTIISVATPKISTQFHALDDVGWYGAAYLMTLTAITPVAANFYKYFNPKHVYLASIAIFEVGSAVCASAPTSNAFIIGRALAGVGAAGLLQGAFGILTYVCTLEKRPIFLGVVVSLFGLFSSIGPVIGGALTESITWRWCFWINLPIGGVVLVLVVFFLTLKGVDQSTRSLPLSIKFKRLDLPGVVLIIAAVSCLFLALEEGSAQVPWSSPKPIGLFVGFGLLLITFGVWQWKAGDNATIPFHFFKDRTVVWGSLYLLWDLMASYVAIYYLPFYFQAALNDSPLRSGVNYMALAVPQMIGLLAGGGIVTVWGQYVSSRETFPARQGLTVLVQMPVILFAQVLCAIGSGLLTTLRTDTSTALWGTYLALTGLGLGLGVNVPHIAIQAVMKTALGVPIGNALLIGGLRSEVPKFAPDVSSEAVVRNGALDLQRLTSSPTTLQGLRTAYATAISHVNIFLVVLICISVPTACGMKWLNIKEVSRLNEEEKKRKREEEKSIERASSSGSSHPGSGEP